MKKNQSATIEEQIEYILYPNEKGLSFSTEQKEQKILKLIHSELSALLDRVEEELVQTAIEGKNDPDEQKGLNLYARYLKKLAALRKQL